MVTFSSTCFIVSIQLLRMIRKPIDSHHVERWNDQSELLIPLSTGTHNNYSSASIQNRLTSSVENRSGVKEALLNEISRGARTCDDVERACRVSAP